jgi:hypothetical protein
MILLPLVCNIFWKVDIYTTIYIEYRNCTKYFIILKYNHMDIPTEKIKI